MEIELINSLDVSHNEKASFSYFAIRPKNRCVSANPTDPIILCRPCNFYCYFNIK